MEKIESLNRKRIADISEIPENVFGVPLTQYEREKLSYGELSDFHEGLLDESTKSFKDGKFKFTRDIKTNDLKVAFVFEKEKVTIPQEIEINGTKKKLNTEEIDDLKQGKTVLLQVQPNEDIYVKVDKETQNIVYSTGKELGIPDQLGNYILTAEDKLNLETGKPIGTRLFEGVNKGEFYLANIRITEDKMNMIFMDYKSVDKNVNIEELREKHNTPPTPSKKELDDEKIIINHSELNPEVIKAIDDKNFSKLREIKDNGHKATNEEINHIKTNDNLTREEKIATLTTLGINNEINKEEEQKIEFRKAVDEKNDSKLKDLTNKGFKPEEKEINYLVNHKNINAEEKKDMLSHLSINPDKKQETDIKIDKIEEKVKEQKLTAENKQQKPKNNKMTSLITSAVHDM